jgi:hypothetical protein
VVREELAIDGATALETVFHVVPKADALLAEFPAKQDLFAVIKSGKVDQSDVDVFDLTAGGVYRIDRRLQVASGFRFPALKFEEFAARRYHAAGYGDAVLNFVYAALKLFVQVLQLYQTSQLVIDLGQQPLRF